MLKLKKGYLLSRLTTLQIGGPAKFFVTAKTQEELIEAIKYAKKKQINYLVIGGGSNLLVSDEGINSLIIKNEVSGIEQTGQNLVVKSGTVLQELVTYTIEHGLLGLHKLTGIPGTVGGGVFGNAGAYGQTISDYITQVLILNGNQKTKLTKEECCFGYRDSNFKNNKHTILEIYFQLKATDPKVLAKEARDTLSQRLIKYPKETKCPGSFFKNILVETLPQKIVSKIPKDKIHFGKINAGSLLEEVGAKGQCQNEIEIAPYHANLFINRGNGNAKDFYNLAKKYHQKVKEKFGITLESEVQLIGFKKSFTS